MNTSIKILGPGCARCKSTFEVVKKVVEQSGIQADISKIEKPYENDLGMYSISFIKIA